MEPAFGEGAFLSSIIDRIFKSYTLSIKDDPIVFDELKNCVRAVEIRRDIYRNVKEKITKQLVSKGISDRISKNLADVWLINDDFLTHTFEINFDFVVGNPPYIRQEEIPFEKLVYYRSNFKTFYDRADIYVAFIENSINLLNVNSIMGFICSDRWIKNKYGGPLRKLVSTNYHLKYYIDMYGADPFTTDVSAYPAIFAIEKHKDNRVKCVPDFRNSKLELDQLLKLMQNDDKTPIIHEVKIPPDAGPWLLESSIQKKLIERLEEQFPLIERAGCEIGIGVATGNDGVFIGTYDKLDVESERKVPLVLAKDITNRGVNWSERYILNPFESNGKLIDLQRYPKAKAYLETNKPKLTKRHVAKKNPASWYRTIDRIKSDLLTTPKLLIPDIKGEPVIALDSGKYYPHHNVYYITSGEWDLRALRMVLLTGIAKLFVSSYSVKIRGDYMRFQAQYLRKIRLPNWKEVPESVKQDLIKAHENNDMPLAETSIRRLFSLTEEECEAIGINGM